MILNNFNPVDIKNNKFIVDNNVTEIIDLLFHNCYNIDEIVLPNQLTNLGNAVFWNCTNLKYINIPLKLEKMGFSAFKNCVNLTSINLNCNLKEIETETFLDCTNLLEIELNCPLEKIGSKAFQNCKSLKRLIIPKSVNKIGENALNGCTSLEFIELPENISAILEATFKNCINLKKIIIPDKVVEIGDLVFYNCENLEEIKLPKKLKQIGDICFSGCHNLKGITLPNNLKIIGNGAFKNTAIEKIEIPISVIEIGKSAFDNTNLKSIKFESSLIFYDFGELQKLSNLEEIIVYGTKITNIDEIKQIQVTELLDKIYEKLVKNNHIYNLTRESLNKFYQKNYNFTNIVNYIIYKTTNSNYDYKKDIEKFDALFSKTRFVNLPSKEIFENLTITLSLKYKPKIVKELINIPIFTKTEKTKKNIVDVISIFGLFEEDNQVYNRLRKVINLFSINTYIDSENFCLLKNLSEYFEKIVQLEYVLNDYVRIPHEYEEYLTRTISKTNLAELKKLDKRIGKKVNDFFKENYTLKENIYYRLKTDIDTNTLYKIYDEILESRVNNQITIESLNNIFDEIPKQYNKKISEFIFKNFNHILYNLEYQKNIKNIIQKYDEIEKFYLSKGHNNFNYVDALKYLSNYTFSNIKNDNHEFAKLVKNAGVVSQEKFEKYQDLYEKIKNNRDSIIPRLKEDSIVEVNGANYKISVEILRKDDPFTMLVGEAKYTDCCQVFDDSAESSMIHACTDGRIFCTYLINDDGNKELLSQSWVWRCGNTICFDNIELTSLSKSKKIYKDVIYNCYKLASDKIIDTAKNNNDKIDVIMIGCKNDDLKLENYFNETYENNIKPINYNGYVDSTIVCYMCGNQDLIDLNYIQSKKYLDERRTIVKKINQIPSNMLKKVRDICKNCEKESKFINFLDVKDNNLNIVIGEDWYCIYTVENGICIKDLQISRPKYIEEEKTQMIEVKEFIQKILGSINNVLDNALNNNLSDGNKKINL